MVLPPVETEMVPHMDVCKQYDYSNELSPSACHVRRENQSLSFDCSRRIDLHAHRLVLRVFTQIIENCRNNPCLDVSPPCEEISLIAERMSVVKREYFYSTSAPTRVTFNSTHR